MLTPDRTLSEMLTLQAELAYSAARSDVECYCAAGGTGNLWYDTTNVLDDDHDTVARAIRYLELRGLLERHMTQPWVRVRDEDDVATKRDMETPR